MPRGVPKSGVRMTQKRLMSGDVPTNLDVFVPVSNETDEEIDARIRERFEVMNDLALDTTTGENRAMIISGPAGLGKSYNVEAILKNYDKDGKRTYIQKGFARATGLYKLLWAYKNPGDVLVFDDCDSIFFDDDALNLLKGACDTTEVRKIGWAAETKMEDESGERLPSSFIFEGSIIFITNYDMDAAITQGHRLAPHFEALISRAYYIDLAMKSRRDYIIRIKQVAQEGMFIDLGLNKSQIGVTMDYLESNRDALREVSIRMAVKLAKLVKNKNNWEKTAKITLLNPNRR
jgi:hypothetical protein